MRILAAALVLLLGAASLLAAQTPPASADELAELRARADDSFADDDLDSAIRLYRELAEKTVEPAAQVDVLVIVAWVEFLAGRSPEAVDTLTEALTRVPDMEFQAELYSEEFRRLFAIARTRAKTRRDQLTYEHLRRGIDAMKAHDYTAARQAFELAVAAVPDHPQGLYNLALAYLYEGNRDAAMAGFQKLVSLAAARPGTVDEKMQALAWVNIGYLQNARHAYAEAEAALARATELDPGNATAWVNLGSTRRGLGKVREAAEAFRRAASLDPDDPTVIVNLGISYIDLRDWVSAAALLREATARFPGHGGLWLHLGRAQVGLGNPSLAIASFERAIQADPQNAGGWAAAASVELARAHYGDGRFEACLRAADQALAWSPDRADARIYQGLARKALGDLDGALESFEEARRLDPTLAEAHYNLGTVYLELGRTSDAAAAFERALALDPGHADARASLEKLRGGAATTSPNGSE